MKEEEVDTKMEKSMNVKRMVVWMVLVALTLGVTSSYPVWAEELEEAAAPKWMALIGMDPPGLPEVRIYTWSDYKVLPTMEDGNDRTIWTVPPIDSRCRWVESSNGFFWWPTEFFTREITDPSADDFWSNYQPTNEIIDACYPEEAKVMMIPYSSYREILTGAITTWEMAPYEYWGYASYLGENFKTRSAISFGMLQSSTPMTDTMARDFVEGVLPVIYNSPWMLQVLFDWAMPAVESAFKEMPSDHQRAYLDILRHGQAYLKGYDHRREENYLERLENGICAREESIFRREETEWYKDECTFLDWDGGPREFCPCTRYFVRISPDGKMLNKYRKLEAFFFRRVRQGVEASTLLHWVTRTRERLEAAAE